MKSETLIDQEHQTAKKFHVVVTDDLTGKVLTDYTTETALIAGAIQENEGGTPTSILFVGSPEKLMLLENVLFQTISRYFHGKIAPKKKDSN